MVSRDLSTFGQIIGALISSLGIFFPGTLLIFFIYPIWEQLKSMKGIKVALTGIVAVAGGLIAIAAFKLIQDSGFTLVNIVVMVVKALLLLTKKIPVPFIVILAIVLGILI